MSAKFIKSICANVPWQASFLLLLVHCDLYIAGPSAPNTPNFQSWAICYSNNIQHTIVTYNCQFWLIQEETEQEIISYSECQIDS